MWPAAAGTCCAIASLWLLVPQPVHAGSTASREFPCWDKGNTLDISTCFAEAGRQADAELNRTYARILSVLEEPDAANLRSTERMWNPIAINCAGPREPCGAAVRVEIPRSSPA
jgi:uncharacterized protein YecT (DUF1311 family)